MELSYLNGAKQVFKYGQRIGGNVRSAETPFYASRASLQTCATLNYPTNTRLQRVLFKFAFVTQQSQVGAEERQCA